MSDNNLIESSQIVINGRPAIGRNLKPYIISEIGTNHNRNIETARELVRKSATAGCDCAKFQIYEPNEIVSAKVRSKDYGLDIKYGDISAQDVFEKYLKTPKEWFPELCDLCHELSMDCCVTIHGENGLQWARNLDIDIVKIASMDHTNLPLMESLINTINVPILASFGMATLADIDKAVSILRLHKKGFALFHCVSMYPPKPTEVHLNNIPFLNKRYNLNVGFSDHTEDVVTSATAVALGATVFEKHITLDRKQEGPDHGFALEPNDMNAFVSNINDVYLTLSQDGFVEPSKREYENRTPYLKSIITKYNMKADHCMTYDDVYLARPGTGMHPGELHNVVGRILLHDIDADEPLNEEDLIPKTSQP